MNPHFQDFIKSQINNGTVPSVEEIVKAVRSKGRSTVPVQVKSDLLFLVQEQIEAEQKLEEEEKQQYNKRNFDNDNRDDEQTTKGVNNDDKSDDDVNDDLQHSQRF